MTYVQAIYIYNNKQQFQVEGRANFNYFWVFKVWYIRIGNLSNQ